MSQNHFSRSLIADLNQFFIDDVRFILNTVFYMFPICYQLCHTARVTTHNENNHIAEWVCIFVSPLFSPFSLSSFADDCECIYVSTSQLCLIPSLFAFIFLTIFHHHCHLLITNKSTFQPF